MLQDLQEKGPLPTKVRMNLQGLVVLPTEARMKLCSLFLSHSTPSFWIPSLLLFYSLFLSHSLLLFYSLFPMKVSLFVTHSTPTFPKLVVSH